MIIITIKAAVILLDLVPYGRGLYSSYMFKSETEQHPGLPLIK